MKKTHPIGPSLGSVLSGLTVPNPLPLPLPAGHLSLARWFRRIVSNARLQPTQCRVFGRDVLYLFYGGVLYRPKGFITRDMLEAPVAFLFEPTILERVDRYYPFDTGAMAASRYGPWSKEMTPFEHKFSINGRHSPFTPAKLIFHLYESNKNYLRGIVSKSALSKPDPFPILYNFLTSDLTGFGVDHRQQLIECMYFSPLELDHNLIWIAFPYRMTEEFALLYEQIKPRVPEYWAYEYHQAFNPRDIAAQIESKAREIVERYVDLP